MTSNEVPALTLERFRALRSAVRDKDTPLSLCMPSGIDYAAYVGYRQMIGSDEYKAWLKGRDRLGENHPLASTFGVFEDEPLFDELIEAMKQNRRDDEQQAAG